MEDHSEYIIKLLHKKNVIRDWIAGKYKEKPIIIYGSSGIGKTSLANYILKEFTKITINLDFCKSGKSFDEYLDMSLYKKSITMMFDRKNTDKAILFDDLNYIQDYDKKLFKNILDFSKKKITNHPTIYIFNHINHKNIQIIYKKAIPIHISFSKNQYASIVRGYFNCPLKVNVDELVEKSNRNFHMIKSNLDFYQNDSHKIQIYDQQEDELSSFIRTIFKCNMNELYRVCSSDYTIISLNILENCIEWLWNQKKLTYQKKIKLLNEVYHLNCIGDNLLTLIHIINDWQLLEHLLTFSVVLPICHLNKHVKIKTLIYNKYISKSIIYTHNTKLLHQKNITIHQLSFFYRLLYSYHNHPNKETLQKIHQFIHISSINEKLAEKFNKYFDPIISKKTIQQIFKDI